MEPLLLQVLFSSDILYDSVHAIVLSNSSHSISGILMYTNGMCNLESLTSPKVDFIDFLIKKIYVDNQLVYPFPSERLASIMKASQVGMLEHEFYFFLSMLLDSPNRFL